MSDVIPLTADIVFKYVLGSRDSTKNLAAFLSAVQLDSGFPALRYLDIDNPFNIKSTKRDKMSVIDVRAVDENGYRYNVEVQALLHPAFAERTLYYWARAYSGQLGEK